MSGESECIFIPRERIWLTLPQADLITKAKFEGKVMTLSHGGIKWMFTTYAQAVAWVRRVLP